MATIWFVTAGLLLLSCGCVSSFSFPSIKSTSSGQFQSHDLNPQEMQVLLGQPVVRMRMVERPKTGGDLIEAIVSHSGVEVVTKDGRRFLIHKGGDYGGGNRGGNTVVVDAKHMSKKWKPVTDWKVPNKETRVTDMVRAGGKNYNEFRDNCHHASENMMYGGGKKDKGIYLKPHVPKEDRIANDGKKVEEATGRSMSRQKGRAGSELRTGGSKRKNEVKTGGSGREHEVRTGGSRLGREVRTGGSRLGREVRTGGSRLGREVRTGGSRLGREVRTGGSRLGREVSGGNSRRG